MKITKITKLYLLFVGIDCMNTQIHNYSEIGKNI